jgi:hypothetical protein
VENVTMTIGKDEKLVITVDLKAKGAPSKSGKTIVLASTKGNVRLKGREEFVGLNVYRPL